MAEQGRAEQGRMVGGKRKRCLLGWLYVPSLGGGKCHPLVTDRGICVPAIEDCVLRLPMPSGRIFTMHVSEVQYVGRCAHDCVENEATEGHISMKLIFQ